MGGASVNSVPVPTEPRGISGKGSLIRSRTVRHVAGAMLGGSIGLLMLIGFALNWERAWRPIAGYPATHPTTAICIVLLAFGLSPHQRSGKVWRGFAKAAVVYVLMLMLALLALHVFDPLAGFRLIDALAPFKQVLAEQAAAGPGWAWG